MPTQKISLAAQPRTIRGGRLSGLRRKGQVPGIIYGHGRSPQMVLTSARELEQVWHQAGSSKLVEVSVGDHRAIPVLLRDLQRDPRYNHLVHVDMFAVDVHEKVTVDVPLLLVGEAPAVSDLKIGQLLQTVSSLRVECLPRDLPANIPVDISGLVAVDDAVPVSALKLPAGVTLLHTDPEELVVKVAALRVASVETEAPAAAAAAAGTEGEPESTPE